MTSGPAAGTSLEVEHDVVIGREGADLTLADDEVSRRHAVVRPVERGVVVEDLGSTNGTFVNGEQISTPVTLTLGSTLRLGNSVIEVELDLGAPTKLREVVPAGEPTVAREVPRAAPPEPEPVAAAVPEPPATEPPPPAEPPPAKRLPGGPREPAPPPRYGGPSDSDRSRPAPALIVAVLAGVAVLVAVLVLVVL